jgi:hypothetical protein
MCLEQRKKERADQELEKAEQERAERKRLRPATCYLDSWLSGFGCKSLTDWWNVWSYPLGVLDLIVSEYNSKSGWPLAAVYLQLLSGAVLSAWIMWLLGLTWET